MKNAYMYILIMAVTTYLIRMIPLVFFKREFKSVFFKSFLYYVPYACLATMTFPSILYATKSVWSGLIGFIVAVFFAYREKSMVKVAIYACAAVFIAETAIRLMGMI